MSVSSREIFTQFAVTRSSPFKKTGMEQVVYQKHLGDKVRKITQGYFSKVCLGRQNSAGILIHGNRRGKTDRTYEKVQLGSRNKRIVQFFLYRKKERQRRGIFVLFLFQEKVCAKCFRKINIFKIFFVRRNS